MQILIGLDGLGVPKTSLGVGAAVGKLYFRVNPQTVKEKAFTISNLLSVGQKSGRAGEASDKYGHICLVEFATGNGQHHLGKVVFGSIKVKAIQGEKGECRHRADTLVAIGKRTLN
jgi:hypothetical protein